MTPAISSFLSDSEVRRSKHNCFCGQNVRSPFSSLFLKTTCFRQGRESTVVQRHCFHDPDSPPEVVPLPSATLINLIHPDLYPELPPSPPPPPSLFLGHTTTYLRRGLRWVGADSGGFVRSLFPEHLQGAS